MSNDKEFEFKKEIKDSELQGFTKDALVALVISLEETEIYQQKIINKKDKEIESLNKLYLYMDDLGRRSETSHKEELSKKDAEIERLKKENDNLKSALSIALSHYIEFPDDEEYALFIAHCQSLLKKSSEVESE